MLKFCAEPFKSKGQDLGETECLGKIIYMYVAIQPGTYVVAVSGGVDSMVLLDLLAGQIKRGETQACHLIVAHFDHGMREDSVADRQLVQRVAEHHGLPFVFDEGELGAHVSEATARTARYEFLHQVRLASGGQAIITAHHQDDVLETAVINVLRGTGRRGLSSLTSGDQLLRPLLAWTKHDIHDYATQHHIVWHEDSTNADETYLRNYVRRNILNKFSDAQRNELVAVVERAGNLNNKIDALLVNQLHIQPAPHQLDRWWFVGLSHAVAREVLAGWLRGQGVRSFDKKTLERLVTAAKTYAPGKQTDVTKTRVMRVTNNHLALVTRDR
jgi:tRNA(Ile)-lysidine synthase